MRTSDEKKTTRNPFKRLYAAWQHGDDAAAKNAVSERSDYVEQDNRKDGLSKSKSSSLGPESFQTGLSSSTESTPTLDELVMRDSWQVALDNLRGKNDKILAAYEQDLVQDSSKRKGQEREIDDARVDTKQMKQQQLVHEALRGLQEGEFVIPRRFRQAVIGQKVQSIVHIVLSVKDVISQAVAAEPYASLAWPGVLVILPVSIPTCIFQNIDSFI